MLQPLFGYLNSYAALPTNMRGNMEVEVFLISLFILGCSTQPYLGTPKYYQTGSCEDKICEYNYEATLCHREDFVYQNVTTYATIEVACDSTGRYGYHNATQYCVEVMEAYIEHTGFNGTMITPLDKLLPKWFCYIQLQDGKIPAVSYARTENRKAINFMKGIVAGFQANFKGTKAEEETDPQSMHFSHYSYPKRHRGRSWWMHRRFTNFDVDTTATPLPEPIELTQNEDIHYEDGVLQCANGTINLWIPLRPHRRPRPGGQSVQDSMMGKEPDIMNRPKRGRVPFGIRARRPTLKPALYIGLHRFSITSKYTLELVSCSSETDVVARRKREIENSQRDEYLSSSLYTSIDHVAQKKERLQELKETISSVQQTLEYIHKHPQDTKQANLLKEFLLLEDRYGSVVQSHLAVSDVLLYLQNIQDSFDPEDTNMRQIIYGMLYPLKSASSQQALLLSLEHVTDKEEWNSLLLNIALLATPNKAFALQLEILINGQHNENTQSLLLAYGAIASRAQPDLRSHMITFLRNRTQKSTTDEKNLINLIHSLGNSGSHEVVPFLLDYTNHSNMEVQVAAINALRKTTDNEQVQAALLVLLRNPDVPAGVVGAIASTLVKGLDESEMSTKRQAIILKKAIITASRRQNSIYMERTVNRYLDKMHQRYIRLSRSYKQSWSIGDPKYDVIATHESRQRDEEIYSNYESKLWEKEIGLEEFNLQIAVGLFSGTGAVAGESKMLGKAEAKVKAFGESTTAMEIEMLRSQSADEEIHRLVYLSIGGFVLVSFEAFSDDEFAPSSYIKGTEYNILEVDWEVFVVVATVKIEVSVFARIVGVFEVEKDVNLERNMYRVEGLFSPNLTIRAEGSSVFDVLGTRGGITLDGLLGYMFDARMSIDGCTHDSSVKPGLCVTAHEQWPKSYVHLSSWYQTNDIESCGLEYCYKKGGKTPEFRSIPRWEVSARHPVVIWDEWHRIDDNAKCSPNPATPSLSSAPPEESQPTWPTWPTRPPYNHRPRPRPTHATESVTQPWEKPSPNDDRPYPNKPLPDKQPDILTRPSQSPFPNRNRPYDYPDKTRPIEDHYKSNSFTNPSQKPSLNDDRYDYPQESKYTYDDDDLIHKDY